MAFSLLLTTSVMAQPGVPKPCLYPAAFTTEMETFNYFRNEIDRGMVAYDGANERLYEQRYSRGHDGSDGEFEEFIVLYKDDVSYAIDHRSDHISQCTYGPIEDSRKFTPFGVPTNASFHSEITMGITPDTFQVNEFGMRGPGYRPNTTITVHMHVTKEGCMPVKTQMFVEQGEDPDGHGMENIDMSETRDYFNSVLGIEDPSVFIPPSGCTKRPPPGPPPAPGPAPPNPTRDCFRGLETDCGKIQHNATLCAECAKKVGEQFHCTATEDEEFCRPRPPAPPGPRPPTPPGPAPPSVNCWEGLVKACNATRAQGPKACAACTVKEGPAFKCATSEDIEFCSSTDRTCWQGLEKDCGSDTKGPVCAVCAKKVGVTLHCPADEEERFCEPRL